jgi:hypothetical protein
MKKSTPFIDPLKPAKRPAPQDAWLITMADLTALLVAMFVLIFSTRMMNSTNFDTLSGSLRATFAPTAVAVPVTPNSQQNAEAKTNVRRGVGYLNHIFRLRLLEDPVWQTLRGTESPDGQGFVYPISPTLQAVDTPEAQALWQRLGAAVRTFQTPVAVRVVVPEGQDLATATARSWALAQAASKGGGRVTAEVQRGTIAQTQWIIYGTE